MIRALVRTKVENPLSRYEDLNPDIDMNEFSKQFKIFNILSALPIAVGGVCSLYFPYAGLYTEFVPNIGLCTMMYAAMHSTILCGIHIGFGAIESVKALPMLETDIPQLIVPIFGPLISGYSTYLYWSSPFIPMNCFISLGSVSALYLGLLAGDYHYCKDNVSIPSWYFDLKVKITSLSLIGLSSLALAIYLYPDQLKLPSIDYPPTLEEILEN